MKYCPNCKTGYEDSFMHCPQCGGELTSIEVNTSAMNQGTAGSAQNYPNTSPSNQSPNQTSRGIDGLRYKIDSLDSSLFLLMWFGAIPGIIFGLIGLNKNKAAKLALACGRESDAENHYKSAATCVKYGWIGLGVLIALFFGIILLAVCVAALVS